MPIRNEPESNGGGGDALTETEKESCDAKHRDFAAYMELC